MSNRIVGYIKALLQLLFLSQNHMVVFFGLFSKVGYHFSLQLFFKKCKFLVMYRNAFFK